MIGWIVAAVLFSVISFLLGLCFGASMHAYALKLEESKTRANNIADAIGEPITFKREPRKTLGFGN